MLFRNELLAVLCVNYRRRVANYSLIQAVLTGRVDAESGEERELDVVQSHLGQGAHVLPHLGAEAVLQQPVLHLLVARPVPSRHQ